jgi:hypothetical protein
MRAALLKTLLGLHFAFAATHAKMPQGKAKLRDKRAYHPLGVGHVVSDERL